MADEPKTVTMRALALHTYNWTAYDVGDTYELDERFVDSVVLQGKAVRADAEPAPPKPAKRARRDEAKEETLDA